MLVILDPCTLSLSGEPSGGITIMVKEVEGLQGISLAVPIGREALEAIYTEVGKVLNKPTIHVPLTSEPTAMTEAELRRRGL